METSNQLCNGISVRLDDTNYHTWHFLMRHYLRAYGLLKFVDGSYHCPSQFQMADYDSLSIDNTGAFEKWLQQDSCVISLITASHSANALTLVIGCETSMEVWTTLKQRYAPKSEFHIMRLKSTLQNIRKGPDSIQKYLLRFKDVRNQLAVAGVSMSDEDMKTLILAGLPSEYAHTRQIIRGKNHIDMEEVRSLLLSAEFEIELAHKVTPLSSFTAMVAHYGSVSAASQNFHNSLPSITQNQGLYNSGYMNKTLGSSWMPVTFAAPNQRMYSHSGYVNECSMPSGVIPNMNGMTTMNHLSLFNAAPTSATTQFGFVSPWNTMAANSGFSTDNTMAANSGFSNGPNSSSYGGHNNASVSNSSKFNYPASSAGFLANNSSVIPQQQGFSQNNHNPQQNNGYSQSFYERNGYAGKNNGSKSSNGCSNDNGAYLNFLIQRGSGNNNRNNGKANCSNPIICQICEKPGHSAWKCYQRNTQPTENGASTFSMTCQIYKRPGHVARNYFYRKQNNNHNSQNGSTAMIACCDNSPTPIQHEVWLTDSGATNHTITNVQNLRNMTSYASSDAIQIGTTLTSTIEDHPHSIVEEDKSFQGYLCPSFHPPVGAVSTFLPSFQSTTRFKYLCCNLVFGNPSTSLKGGVRMVLNNNVLNAANEANDASKADEASVKLNNEDGPCAYVASTNHN